MALSKVDAFVGPLTEGRCYLVPTVVGSVNGSGAMRPYPVIGTRHYDVEYFNVHMPHYHLDMRFIDMDRWRGEMLQGVLIGAGRRNDGTYPVPEYKKMKCLQSHVEITIRPNSTAPDGFEQMKRDFKGAQCGGSRKRGWTCPHKGTFLGGQPALLGVITCPAHSLRIDAKTGRVL